MTTEIWKEIPGYEDRYQVSNLGRVKSLPKQRNYGDCGNSELILKLKISPYGYHVVNLWKNGQMKSFKVHRLVAKCFIPTANDELHINHLDSDRLNNKITNLEWCTPKENVHHAIANGNLNQKGEAHSQAKLTDTQVKQIRESKLKPKELAKKYNVTTGMIWLIRTKQNWKHLL